MWRMTPLARATFRVALFSTMPITLVVLAALTIYSTAATGDNVLHNIKPVTDDMLEKSAPEDWLTRRGATIAPGAIARSLKFALTTSVD